MSNYKFGTTDLDNLFYTDNMGAGALGFVDQGTDLGNKYTDASELGYEVGYKVNNSLYTNKDLGYLRGNYSGPEITSMGFKYVSRTVETYTITYLDGDEESGYWYYYNFTLQPTFRMLASNHTYKLRLYVAFWTQYQTYPCCHLGYRELGSTAEYTYKNLTSNNGGQCGNRHANESYATPGCCIQGMANEEEDCGGCSGGGRTWQTYEFTVTQGWALDFRIKASEEYSYLIQFYIRLIDNTTGDVSDYAATNVFTKDKTGYTV